MFALHLEGEQYWEFSNLWHNTRFGKTNLTMLANIGWNANDQKIEVRWSLLRKVHHFGREIMNSDISRIYWNSQNLREDLVPVAFIEAFSLWFQTTELHNYDNRFLLLFSVGYHGPVFHLGKQSSCQVIMLWIWRNLVCLEINCAQCLNSTNLSGHVNFFWKCTYLSFQNCLFLWIYELFPLVWYYSYALQNFIENTTTSAE